MFPIIKTFVLLAAAAATTLAQPHSLSCSSTASAQPTPSVDASAQLLRDLQSAPTAIKRFQRLLVQGGSLLTGDALRKLIVFDFKGAQPASGALGGSAKAAVSVLPDSTQRCKLWRDTDKPFGDLGHRVLPFLSRSGHQHNRRLSRAMRDQHPTRTSTRQ